MTYVPDPAAGADLLADWGTLVAEAVSALMDARLPFAMAPGLTNETAESTTRSLAVVSAGNAGAVAIPYVLAGRMALQSLTIRQGSTSAARAAEFRLYKDNGDATFDFIAGTDGTFSFTPGAIDERTANISAPGTIIGPGLVWLVIRNTSAAQTFQVRLGANASSLSGAYTRTLGTVAALGATQDFSGWTDSANVIFCRLNGRIGAEVAAY